MLCCIGSSLLTMTTVSQVVMKSNAAAPMAYEGKTDPDCAPIMAPIAPKQSRGATHRCDRRVSLPTYLTSAIIRGVHQDDVHELIVRTNRVLWLWSAPDRYADDQ